VLVELHILQNFAPSNLNRDDTGAPKDCEFGGYRRARVSSQCLKRAVRQEFRKQNMVDGDRLAERTKRLLDELADALARDHGRDRPAAVAAAGVALRGVGLAPDDEGKTQYLLFLARDEIRRLAGLVREHWEELTEAAQGGPPAAGPGPEALAGDTAPAGAVPAATKGNKGAKAKQTAKDKKKADKAALSGDLKKKLEAALDGGKAVDLALFGRMLADLPDRNVDAACQVAHALSTNKVSVEMDYYTAVDDLKPEDTAGADMIGTVEFASSCFYRYACVDFGQLTENLSGDAGLARRAVGAFLRASVDAVPTGKQNSFAAHNPPSLVFAVVRGRGQWSLANAFVQPVRPSPARDLVQGSAEALDAYWARLVTAYGRDGLFKAPVHYLGAEGLTDDNTPLTAKELKYLGGHLVRRLDEVYRQVDEALAGWTPAEAAR
jgi:CRISPR system Cascade subunit CasC